MSTSTTLQDRLAGTWKFNPTHSSAEFAVKYVVSTFRGAIEELSASIDDGTLTGGAQVASIRVKDDNLTGHLMAPDFFDVEQFPEISFRSTNLSVESDALTLEGELTLKGVTQPITARGTIEGPADDFMGNTRLGLTLDTVIDRTAFGISWNADLPSGGKALADDVSLHVELEFGKAA